MRQSMKFALAVALGTGLTSAPSLYAEKTYATSNVWFKVVASEMTADPTANGTQTSSDDGCDITWTAVPSANDGNTCALTGDTTKQLSLNTSHTSPLTITPATEGDASLSRVYATVTISACDVLPTTTDAKMGLCVFETDGTYSWYYLNSGTWTAATTETAPTIGATYEICLETDVANSKARWLAKKTSDTADTDYTTITGWISSSALASQISTVSFYGSTLFDNFGAQIVRTITISDDVEPSNYTVVVIDGAKGGASVFVDPSSEWMTTNKEKMTNYDSDPKAAMNAEAANGLTYLQSYVLGLDPTKAANKPLVNAQQSDDTGKVVFKLDGIDYNSTAGARVKYCVKAYDNANLSDASPTVSDLADPNETVSLDLPASGSNVKYYKVEITID